jgi:hypothetical protein
MPRTIYRGAAQGSSPASVDYTHTNGKTYSAIITSPGGTATQLNLKVPSLKGTASYTLTNIDRRTTARGGAGYLGRWSL